MSERSFMSTDETGTGSAKRRKGPRRKARGEFVWVSEGVLGQYPARLVIPMDENPPRRLDGTDEVEVQYTSSGMLDWVENQYIEYPNASVSRLQTTQLGSRRSIPRKRKGRDVPETNNPAPSEGRGGDEKYSGGARNLEVADKGKCPADKPKHGESYVSTTYKQGVAVEGEPEAIKEDGGQKKKRFADVKGYCKEDPVSRHEDEVQKSADTSDEAVLENTGKVKETTDKTKSLNVIQDVVEDADGQQQQTDMEEPHAKRQSHDSAEAASTTLNSLVTPLINAGQAIFNSLFGKP